MKLRDFLKLIENENLDTEIVTPDYEGEYTKDLELIESFVAVDDFDNSSFVAYRDYLFDRAIKNGKDPIRVLRIT